MRQAGCHAGLVLLGGLVLGIGAASGCGGNPNDEISDTESIAAPDAPTTQAEYFEQQQKQQQQQQPKGKAR